MKIDLIVGARPNFVKAAAILEAAKKCPKIQIRLVHTGQHQGVMSDLYFRDLGLPVPDCVDWRMLGGDAFYAYEVTDRLGFMIASLADHFAASKPDVVMVVGDCDSTVAGAIAAIKRHIPVTHVEAGLRCGDMKMQEEINRILVDSIATKHYTTSSWAQDNLKREGKTGVLVGNVMVDTLYRFLNEARRRYPRREGDYAVLTLHRAENVDDPKKFAQIIDAVEEVAIKIPVIWPVHPRCGPFAAGINIQATDPMGYLQFISLLDGAKFVVTDSGGVQEETTALGIPCLTLRNNTERPETVFVGTNTVVGTSARCLTDMVDLLISNPVIGYLVPELWDGKAAGRILEDLCAIS